MPPSRMMNCRTSQTGKASLPTRIGWNQIVGAIIDDNLSVMLAAMLDGEHPHIRSVSQAVAPWHLHRFVEPGVAALLDQFGAVGDGLLNQIHHVRLRLVGIARRIVLVLAEVRTDI